MDLITKYTNFYKEYLVKILLKRAYEAPKESDGFRILVDRIWPRGISKEKANIDLWSKDTAPSTSLRKWFSHDPLKWPEFRHRYTMELDKNIDAVQELAKYLDDDVVTFVYGAKDIEHTHAIILKEYLEKFLDSK